MSEKRLDWLNPIRFFIQEPRFCKGGSKLTVSGETLAVGSDDLGLSMISANGGRFTFNLTEETKSKNSRLSSVDRFDLRLSSHDPLE